MQAELHIDGVNLTECWNAEQSTITSVITKRIDTASITVDDLPTTWLKGWKYRKALVVVTGSGEGALTNYPMMVTVHADFGDDTTGTIYLNENGSSSSFDDIRFTSSDGVTVLDYWREDYTSDDQAFFWVKIPSIPADPDTETIYMYYGNSTASYIGNGYNTFDWFFDNTGDLGIWSFGSGGMAISVSGDYVRLLSPTAGAGYAIRDELFTSSNYWTAEIRYKNVSVDTSDQCYFITSTAGAGPDHFSVSAAPYATAQDKWYYGLSPSIEGDSWTEGTEYIIQHVVDETDAATGVDYYVKNTSRVTQSSATGKAHAIGSPTQFDRMYIGDISSSAGCDVYMRWVFVRHRCASEPSWGVRYSIETEWMADKAEVILKNSGDTERYFGGYIASQSLTKEGITKRYICECQDYTVLLDTALVNELYTDKTDREIIMAAIGEYRPEIQTYLNPVWESVGTLDDHVRDLVVHDGNLYAASLVGGGNDKVYRYDGGTTWTSIGAVGVSNLRCLISFDSELYAGDSNGDVYRYDGGTTWTNIWPASPSGNVYFLIEYNGNMYASTDKDNGRVYRYDSGTTWSDMGEPGNESKTFSLAVHNDSMYAGAGSSGYVHKFVSAGSWTSIGQVGSITTVYGLLSFQGDLYAGGTADNNIYRWDGGTTWTDVGATGGTSVYGLYDYDDRLYAGTYGSGDSIDRWDGDSTWAEIGSAIGITNSYCLIAYEGYLYWGGEDTDVYRLIPDLIGEGVPSLDHKLCNRISLRDIIDQLSHESGFDWYVDYYKRLRYLPSSDTLNVAPFGLSDSPDDSTTYPYSMPQYLRDGTNLANLIMVYGGTYRSGDTDFERPNNGQTTEILLPYSLHAPDGETGILVYKNDGSDGTPNWTALGVGTDYINDLGGSIDVLYNYTEKLLKFGTAPPDLDRSILITGQFDTPIFVRVRSWSSYNTYNTWYERKITDKDISTVAEARLRGKVELAKSAFARERGRVAFTQDGLTSGMLLSITDSVYGIDGYYVINRINTRFPGNQIAYYEASFGEYNPDLVDLLLDLKRASAQELESRDDEVLNEYLDIVETFTVSDGTPTVEATGELYYCSPPTGDHDPIIAGYWKCSA